MQQPLPPDRDGCWFRVDSVRYSQMTLSNHFQDGGRLEDLAHGLNSGAISPTEEFLHLDAQVCWAGRGRQEDLVQLG